MNDNTNPDFGYLKNTVALLEKIQQEQCGNIEAAARLMADAIEQDRLIHVYGGGGHTTLVMGEMFFALFWGGSNRTLPSGEAW